MVRMLQTLANMNSHNPFLTMRNTEALAQDRAFPHPHSHIAVSEAIQMHGFESKIIWGEGVLSRFEEFASLPLSYTKQLGLPDRCRHWMLDL